MFQEIKDVLIENRDLLIEILEDCGFYDITKYTSEIRCSLPDGDNSTSVQIYDNLFTNVWTRSNFYDEFEIHDVISLIAFARGVSQHKAGLYLCGMLGLECDSEVKFEKSIALRNIKKHKTVEREYHVKILPEAILNRYPKVVCEDWVKEGIDEEAQREFEVHMDEREKRWCFTLRDWDGNLIGRKGRTWVKDFEILKIPKYLYFHSNGSVTHLFNVHRAKYYIEHQNEVIIVESEKSVMKLWSMGIKNVVAIGNKKITPFMAKQLLQLKCSNFVFALDKDVGFEEVKTQAMKFKLFKNLYIMIDKENELSEKDSPCDRGFLTWFNIYDNRERVRV